MTGWSEQKVARLLSGKTSLHAAHVELLSALIGTPVASLYRGLPKSQRVKA